MLQLQHAALDGIHALAGTYRNSPVKIEQSLHVPPEHYLVPDLITDLCTYVNDHWESSSAIHLAAYVLWRINWIHPFSDGNGRTARIVMYVVLNTKLNGLLAGTPTIPDQIAEDKDPYYEALEAADEAWRNDVVDVSQMEQLLEGMLAKQLLNAVKQATASGELATP